MRVIIAGLEGPMGTSKLFNNLYHQLAGYASLGDFIKKLDIGARVAGDVLPLKSTDTLIQIKRFSEPPVGFLVRSGMFETDAPPRAMIEWLRACDEVWVPSKWAKNVLLRHQISDEKIRVISLGVNTAIFHPFLQFDKSPQIFRFFNVSSLAPRKGIRELLSALKLVVKQRPNVRLSLKLDNFLKKDLGRSEAKSLLIELGVDQHVDLLSGSFSEVDMMTLYRMHDAYVTATRGEGWGLPITEAVACGLPLVAPCHTGLSEFLGPLDGLYWKVESAPEAFSNNLLYESWCTQADGNEDFWHVCNIEAVAEAMIQVVDESMAGEAERKAKLASQIVRQQFSWQVAGSLAMQALIAKPLSRVMASSSLASHTISQ
jgi:glycosyltransferase involved in cell wall biosynthesis